MRAMKIEIRDASLVLRWATVSSHLVLVQKVRQVRRQRTCHRTVSFAVTSFLLSTSSHALIPFSRESVMTTLTSATSCDTSLTVVPGSNWNGRMPSFLLIATFPLCEHFLEPYFSQALSQVIGTSSKWASMACRHGITNVPLATTSYMCSFATLSGPHC